LPSTKSRNKKWHHNKKEDLLLDHLHQMELSHLKEEPHLLKVLPLQLNLAGRYPLI
jgi:hypothetical protein